MASPDPWPEHLAGLEVPARFLNQGKYRLELIVALYYRQWMSDRETTPRQSNW